MNIQQIFTTGLKVMTLVSLGLTASGCGPGQFLGPTITPSPTSTPTNLPTLTPTATRTLMPSSTVPPTFTPPPELLLEDFPIEERLSCEPGGINFYGPLEYTMNAGTIEDAKFFDEADAFKEARVEFTGIVVEAVEFESNTYVLVLVPANTESDKRQPGIVLLRDYGMGAKQFPPHSEIQVNGLFDQLITLQEKRFSWTTNEELAFFVAEISSGGCAP